MNVQLRPATAADAELVYEVTEATMRNYVEAAFGPWVESEQRRIVGDSFDPQTHEVILIDGHVAGIVEAREDETRVQLSKLYILPHFQRQGVGALVLKEVVRTSGRSRKRVWLRVLAVNTDAQRFYTRHGFKVVRRTPQRVYMELLTSPPAAGPGG